MTQHYDIVIVGAGGGGITAAFEAQRRGAKVALLEKYKIGGECTHSGCVPSKALIDIAKHYHAIQNSSKRGLPALDIRSQFNFSDAMEHVKSIVDGVYAHEQPKRFNDMGIDTFIDPSGAKFLDAHTVQIGSERLSGDSIIIATGSGPRLLPTDADKPVHLLNNENFWELREQPESIAFLGGGVISAELGQALARFGTKVTIIDRNDRILGNIDPQIAEYLISELEEMGIEMITQADAQLCSKEAGGGICIDVQQGPKGSKSARKLSVDHLFVAIGRVPNINGLELETAGIDYTPHGITVDEQLKTSVPHIFAVGDVASRAKFSHVANYQSTLVVRNLLNGEHLRNDLSVLPWAIFTDPEIGHVGMTEAEASVQYQGVQTFSVDAATDRFITDSKTGGFLKVVMDADNRILGGTGVGAYAGEWVQILTLAIQQELKAEDLADTIFAYPTYAEIVKKAFSRFLRTKL
jgi:pyruvate/2-oxoglutarate dehydrogenase complex dihydrolipoamide dehydrogenase (E3) component